MKRRSRICVDLHEAGTNVVELLVNRFTYQGRDNWLECIGSGKILVNGRIAVADQILSRADTLEYLPDDTPEPPVDTSFSVLYEDSEILAVNKSGYLPCHPGGRYFNHTLWALIRQRFDLPHIDFVNRIDRETSGIVLVAKTPEAARHCRKQFETHQVRKRYVAVVEGEFPDQSLSARGYLVRDYDSRIRKKIKFCPDGDNAVLPAGAKQCRTVFRNIISRNGLSMVEALPETGRLHQIRASLLALGFCIAGDKMYGVDENFFLRLIDDRLTPEDIIRLRLPRQALHAAELHLSHPTTGRLIRLHAPLPADMKNLMNLDGPEVL
ncbi:MAG: RluA family pseudouridine synthase [Desulfobacterales bacterium]|nr:RluA family pseudouridine synthase [Desulfobacterales bacterium]MDD4072975.1 RluA family pseudouridine synthase [Desulfobacterales bacterium]MDD4393645.1 RluA family pseudouridine synthase [Desulfobacterales bacterium]